VNTDEPSEGKNVVEWERYRDGVYIDVQRERERERERVWAGRQQPIGGLREE
jgi:hypothetical protein